MNISTLRENNARTRPFIYRSLSSLQLTKEVFQDLTENLETVRNCGSNRQTLGIDNRSKNGIKIIGERNLFQFSFKAKGHLLGGRRS